MFSRVLGREDKLFSLCMLCMLRLHILQGVEKQFSSRLEEGDKLFSRRLEREDIFYLQVGIGIQVIFS